jgi:hypothetical protein
MNLERPLAAGASEVMGRASAPVRINAEIAARLEEVAEVLTMQAANPYRVRAYARGTGWA